jgi:adenylosuccinate synthase
VRLNTPTDIVLTKLDVLSGLQEIKVCTGYRLAGQEINYPPQGENALARVEPIYEKLPGWQEDISQVKNWDDLPPNARAYIDYIQDFLGVRVSIVSVGPDRRQTLWRR